METYALVLDVWEGNLNIDEPLLKEGRVAGLIIRLNHITGGHHLDENFYTQWQQAEPFIRWPYFVYNPWASGLANYIWLSNHMPADARRVSIDIEVRKLGYPPATYASEVRSFLGMVRQKWLLDVYSGGGFTDILSPWPTDVPYWWARYLNTFYPKDSVDWSYARLHEQIKLTSWNPGRTPGPCRMWQISGDRIRLPGTCGKCVDVNIWAGTEAELREYAGMSPEKPLPVAWNEAITAWARTMGYTGPGPDE